MAVRIQWRRDTAANWTSYNPTLADGEMGLETDTRKFKIGNGVDNWSTLLYMTIGLSAYEVAVANGFVGTESAWLSSLVGATGPAGADGIDGTNGTNGVDGTDGLSAYEVAVANGFTGTITEWLTSLVGATGATGPAGADGATGPAGADGATGATGPAGAGIPTGGTVGQIIVKNSTTDYDTVWTDNYVEQIRLTAKNDTGGTINKGSVVYVSGANGTNMLLSLADADTESTSSKTIGLLNETLLVNGIGQVITEGIIAGVNTGTATAGQSVWLSTVAGEYVFGAPPAKPAHSVYLGVVTRAHSVNGEIAIKVQNGYESTELHDFSSTVPLDGQVPVWNSTTGLYTPGTISGSGGGYPTISTAVKTTASIATGATETGTLTIAQGYRLLKIETDKAARVRLYTTTTGRDADISRPFGTVTPDINNGVMFDFQTTSENLSDDVNPQVDGYVSTGTAIPITITNLNGSTGTVTVTLTYVRTI